MDDRLPKRVVYFCGQLLPISQSATVVVYDTAEAVRILSSLAVSTATIQVFYALVETVQDEVRI